LAHVEVVGSTGSASEASDWLTVHSNEWDLAIVDLFLAEGSGLTVLASCRVRDVGQRVAVLSNYATREMRSRCEAFGADAVFDKSTELDGFIEFCLDRAI
jgi:DNA-binding NarL/FixJ family response regulator